MTAFLEASSPGSETLAEALRAWLASARCDEPLPTGRLGRRRRCRAHLLVNVRVVDAAGDELGSGRDLAALRAQLGEAAQLSFADSRRRRSSGAACAAGISAILPEIADARARAGARITGYPALVDDGDSVVDRACRHARGGGGIDARRRGPPHPHRAEGCRSRELEKGAPASRRRRCSSRRRFRPIACSRTSLTAAGDRAFVGDDPLPRSEAAFAEQVKRARTRLPAVAEGAFRLFAAIAAEHHGADAADRGDRRRRRPDSPLEVRARRDALVYPGFFRATPWGQLAHLPRYLKALDRRIAKFAENPARDARHAATVAEWWRRYRERLDATGGRPRSEPGLDEFRWLLEELSVSLFAQELQDAVSGVL